MQIFQPMPLQRRSLPFDDPEWIYELKMDGFRALAVIGMVDAQFDQHGTFRRVCRTSCGTTSASARVPALAEEQPPAQVQDRLEECGRGRWRAAVRGPGSAARR